MVFWVVNPLVGPDTLPMLLVNELAIPQAPTGRSLSFSPLIIVEKMLPFNVGSMAVLMEIFGQFTVLITVSMTSVIKLVTISRMTFGEFFMSMTIPMTLVVKSGIHDVK